MSESKEPVKVKLCEVLKVYNSVEHSVARICSNDAINPDNWSDLRKEEYESRIEQYRKYARRKNLEKFALGQKVLVHEDIIENKQNPKYCQGGIVKKIMENDNYEVLHDGRRKNKHASQLRSMLI